MSRIGFIGLGNMGSPMVHNLIAKGYELWVYDVSEEAVSKAVSLGAHKASSIKDLTVGSQVVFTMLQTGEQVKQVCLGQTGIFSALSVDSLYIDCSSIDVQTCREIHEIAKRQNFSMLDAPVSGGVAGARAGALTIMVGGEEATFLRAKPVLECLGKKVVHAGLAGNGQVAKICNNMILGVSMIAVSEGFLLAKELGLEPKKFFEIANNASSQCWSMTHYCPMPNVLEDVPSSQNFQPGFAAAMMLKDLRLSQEAALQAKIGTPLGAEATSLYSLFVENGQGNVDFSGIINMLAGKLGEQ
jgi:3-hydroxyisobutyrate dehydrogenase